MSNQTTSTSSNFLTFWEKIPVDLKKKEAKWNKVTYTTFYTYFD